MKLAGGFQIAVVAAVSPFASEAETPNISLSAIVETWQLASGGIDQGNKSGAYLDLNFDGSLSEGAARYHATVLGYAGNREVEDYTGDFGVFSNLITDSEWIVFTAWIELDHKASNSTIRIGQFASDETFCVSETGSFFLNGNFGAIPTVSANISAPIYSVGAGGIEITTSLDNGYIALGAYAGNPGPTDASNHGFEWQAGGADGYTFIGEWGWRYAFADDKKGVLKIGSYLTTGDSERFDSNETVNGNHAFYAVVDQAIAQIGNAVVNGFLRYGYNPLGERSVVTRYFDLGTTINHIIPNRPQDTLGLALSRTSFSENYLRERRNDGARANDNETVLELSYQAPINETISAQLSAQWIGTPHSAEKDAFIFGLRIVSEF